MPNWCTNTLHVEGTPDDVQAFVKAVTVAVDRIEILRSLHPTPTELVETMAGTYGNNEDGSKKQEQIDLEAEQERNLAKYGAKDWYDWNCENWGTKWADNETYIVDERAGMAVFRFDTAWGPPEKGIAHISTLYPTLTFVLTYEEMGMGFVGASAYRNGCVAQEYVQDIGLEDDLTDSEYDTHWEKLQDTYCEARDKCEEIVRNELANA